MDKEKTIVVFRRWRKSVAESQSIIALFPEIPWDIWDTAGYCSSYEHIGQHGGADYAGVIARSEPCYYFPSAPWANKVTELHKELTGIGYNLAVRQRYIRPKVRTAKRK